MPGQVLARKRLVALETVEQVFGAQMGEPGERISAALVALKFGVDRPLVVVIQSRLDQSPAAAFN